MKRSRKQRIDAAIAYALDRRWDLAVAENQALLEEFPDDIEAANRLGKALTELGDLDGATAAYQRTLELDSTNVIARRNLTRIEEMKGSQTRRRTTKRSASAAAPPPPSVETVRPHSLIEESGKSAEFELLEPNAQALRRVSAGDPAELVPTARGITVRSTTGAILGHIEPRAGLRLRRLIEGGNRYAAVIRRVGDNDASVYVRETHRDPSLVDQPSFLPPAAASSRRRLTPRAYTKASIVRYQADGDASDDAEDEDGDNTWTPRSRRNEEEDEFEERGFSDDGNLGGDDDIEDIAVDDDEEDEPIVDDDVEM
jgi:hypothetical protein